jgi:glutaredoxin
MAMVLVLGIVAGVAWKGVRRVRQALAAQDAAHLAGAPANRVRLYTTSWCPSCAMAKAWLNGQHVDYVNLDVERDAWAWSEYRRLNPRGTIPTFDAYGEVVVGFDSRAYTAALARGSKQAGVPTPDTPP